MNYRRLPFEQYFINTSLDRNHTGRVTYPVKYTSVKYNAGGLLSFLHIMHEMNYEIHYEKIRNVIQLNFEKTTGFTDWFANVVEFSAKYYDAITFEEKPLQLRVHHGWGNMYKSIKREVRKKWQELHEAYPDAETEIVGWSLGSGLAILCCQDLHYNFGVRSHLFTYGSVRSCSGLKRIYTFSSSLSGKSFSTSVFFRRSRKGDTMRPKRRCTISSSSLAMGCSISFRKTG